MAIAELEATIATLARRVLAAENELAALKANQGEGMGAAAPVAKQVAAVVKEPGVQFFRPVEPPPIALPSEDELRKLPGVVFGTYPTLRTWTPGSRYADQDENGFMQQFAAAFTYVAHMGRAEIDHKRSASFWADAASEWHRHRDVRVNIGGSAFLAACIAAGDVAFQRSDQFGNVWAVGLVSWGGRKATDAWRNALRGDLRRPTPGIHKAPAGSGFSVRPG